MLRVLGIALVLVHREDAVSRAIEVHQQDTLPLPEHALAVMNRNRLAAPEQHREQMRVRLRRVQAERPRAQKQNRQTAKRKKRKRKGKEKRKGKGHDSIGFDRLGKEVKK